MIDISHSRKDLLEISDIFSIQINNKYSLTKKDLANELYHSLSNKQNIIPDLEYYFIYDKEELISYLRNPNQTKSIGIKQKDKIIQIARNIIFYTNNDFIYEPHFEDIYDLINKAKYISDYGDISSVRRALRLLKLDKKIKQPIEPKISKRIRIQLQKKEEIKKKKTFLFTKKHKKVSVTFD
mgnify:FL=1|tara:strand:- start:374 stop:919 length:546 start_codon:yes stop_codon:yes gene_type:complete